MRTLAVTRAPGWTELRLTLPGLGNPLDRDFLDELDAAAERIGDDDARHVVLLTAEGPVFSAGEVAGEGAPAEAARPRGALPFRCLEVLPQPVIACIEGDATGAGLELALACDIRVASEEATFVMPQVAQGRMPAAGGTQRLTRLAGRARALEMVLLGEPMTARDAAACGLVNHVAPPGQVRALCERIASRIAAQGPLAVRYAKEAIVRGLDLPLEQALRYETDLTVILQTTADREEGVRAFIEKRKPKFTGR